MVKIKMRKERIINMKKAQMKIQQMSFLLIAVFIFLALVGMMVLTLKMNSLKTSANELREQNAMLLVGKLANSPEFSCGEVYSNFPTDCIDEDKIMMMKDEVRKYSNFWGVTGIEIRRIYPLNHNVICTYENYPKCDTIILLDKSTTGVGRSNFVALCRKEQDKGEFIDVCEMARLTVKYKEAT